MVRMLLGLLALICASQSVAAPLPPKILVPSPGSQQVEGTSRAEEKTSTFERETTVAEPPLLSFLSGISASGLEPFLESEAGVGKGSRAVGQGRFMTDIARSVSMPTPSKKSALKFGSRPGQGLFMTDMVQPQHALTPENQRGSTETFPSINEENNGGPLVNTAAGFAIDGNGRYIPSLGPKKLEESDDESTHLSDTEEKVPSRDIFAPARQKLNQDIVRRLTTALEEENEESSGYDDLEHELRYRGSAEDRNTLESMDRAERKVKAEQETQSDDHDLTARFRDEDDDDFSVLTLNEVKINSNSSPNNEKIPIPRLPQLSNSMSPTKKPSKKPQETLKAPPSAIFGDDPYQFPLLPQLMKSLRKPLYPGLVPPDSSSTRLRIGRDTPSQLLDKMQENVQPILEQTSRMEYTSGRTLTPTAGRGQSALDPTNRGILPSFPQELRKKAANPKFIPSGTLSIFQNTDQSYRPSPGRQLSPERYLETSLVRLMGDEQTRKPLAQGSIRE
ncbi:hypothetical protein ABW19_dt0208548 [Dactylella cylindrospora]|nr:hypothetical protein ABW19_dt0208548 [Dactylella cylindrospora]